MDGRYAAPAPPSGPVNGSGSVVATASYSAGIGLGVALIVMGTLALAVRLSPSLSWMTMWPLVFVVIGIVQMVTPGRFTGWTAHRFAEGIGGVIFGVVLLGCTTGYVEWSMWMTLLSLWPLLLVVAGLKILSGAAGQPWVGAMATVLVWAALLFSAAGAWTGAGSFEPLPVEFVHAVTTAPDAAAAQFAETVVDAVVGPLTADVR